MVFLIIFTIILFLFLLIQWRYHKKNNELENWEKRSYDAYRINEIKTQILSSKEEEWIEIIRKHIDIERQE